ncbi:hypothetical protein HYH03_017688 [Edaphochlamys debaryana]|uniref:Translation factor GUF1 homolog, mitochondrial n=1 Tax=Edaphochlamys debaryana TaxID=47281 RepID=A0A835XHD0_9CHLO|nr:hypothetical protein HYH03_017688 [Edaphochlamys debaryana]|eukprot:KAG2483434.1 hypothetical protein HYH03_017688 [Edaphochlamys debaryana]
MGPGRSSPEDRPSPSGLSGLSSQPIAEALVSRRQPWALGWAGRGPGSGTPGQPTLRRHLSSSSAAGAGAGPSTSPAPSTSPTTPTTTTATTTAAAAAPGLPSASGHGGAGAAAEAEAEAAARAAQGFVGGGYDVGHFPQERIRNFSIIAHVDHGKSTIADRLMEMTGALGAKATHNAQYLDKLQVERERGITVKAQTVSLVYRHRGQDYMLNLIDTPGHVDFSYEVSRSLAACQGALLVVDAGQGVQAQTVANFYLAFEQGLDLVPVINKIDLPAADPPGCAAQMQAAFDLDPAASLYTSAKTGQGMDSVLPAVVERVRPPGGNPNAPARLLLFDALHDEYRGVVLLVEVVDGGVEVGQKLAMASTGQAYEVLELGLLAPERHPTGRLLTGQVGYLVCGIKDLKAARVGDTLYAPQSPGQGQPGAAAAPPRLPGFRPAKAMVFAGLFPLGGDGSEFEGLAAAMDKLLLNDASVVVKRENSDALGPGFRCGFLGMLHMDVFRQRLEQEFGASVVVTTPTVPYILEMPDGTSVTLESAADYPLGTKVARILEPTVTATLIAPDPCVGKLMELCASRRGEPLEHNSLGGGRTLLRYSLPLGELGGDFYSLVKSRSQGYASFDYEEGPYREADLVRLDVAAHGERVDALARMVARGEADKVGRALLGMLRDKLPRQQFEVILQALSNGKVIARETIRALRKDVTAKCYGGDISRKRKLLDRQREGKARMKRMGSIDVPQDLFPELMKVR